MIKRISEYSTFFGEFRRTFDTTGAMTPSGRRLAKALVSPIAAHREPIRILEVGPGTGAVTQEIVRHVRPDDRLDIVELNERFVKVLQRRFDTESSFQPAAPVTNIIHAPVQELVPDVPYDYIVCGLPFNNFPSDLVRSIFRHMTQLLQPDGTLSFFEYLWVRPVKMLVARGDERRRVASVGCVLQWYLERYECAHDKVFLNLFPAVAHHLQFHSDAVARLSDDAVAI